MITYKIQFDKLTEAYIKNEIEPFRPSFCFCGTLMNNNSDWIAARGSLGCIMSSTKICSLEELILRSNKCIKKNSEGFYTLQEVLNMEKVFLEYLTEKGYWKTASVRDKQWEDALFGAFEAALEYLKQVHISKGEIIDEAPVFKRRELSPVNAQ